MIYLLGFSRGGELDAFDETFDLVPLALAGDVGDRFDHVYVAQVVVEIDFDFWALIGIGWGVATGQLQNVGSQFSEIVSKGSGLIDDDIGQTTVGIGFQSEFDRDVGGIHRTLATADRHLDIEVTFLRRDLEGHDEEDQEQEDDIDHRRQLHFRFLRCVGFEFHRHTNVDPPKLAGRISRIRLPDIS
jgi:hypothetical protein